MTLKNLIKTVLDTLNEMKAQNIKDLDVTRLTSITDHMIIASGTSSRHVKSIAEKVIEQSKKSGTIPLGSEGVDEGEWALIDLGDIIIHIMQPAIRDYYQLERLWSVEIQELNTSNQIP